MSSSARGQLPAPPRTSPRLLDALTEVSPEFRDALANTAVFSGTLADRRQDLTALMENGAALGEVGPPCSDTMPNLGCLFSDAADLNCLLRATVLRNLQLGLDLNRAFFGPIDALAVEGHAIGFPQYGSVERNDQTWLRVQTLLPPGEPAASRYLPVRPTPEVRPGGACFNAFGQGVPAVTGGNLVPVREEAITPTPGTATELTGSPSGSTGAGSDQGSSGPVAEGPVGDGFTPAPEGDVLGEQEGGDQSDGLPEQALPPNEQTGSEGDGTDWLWILFIVALTGGAAWMTVMLSRRLGRQVSGDET